MLQVSSNGHGTFAYQIEANTLHGSLFLEQTLHLKFWVELHVFSMSGTALHMSYPRAGRF